MPDIILSGTLNLAGATFSLAKTQTLDFVMNRQARLGASDSREYTFDVAEGTVLKFLFIQAKRTADPTQDAEVQLSFDDNDGADPPNGSSWVEINGLELGWREDALSTTNNSFYVYNSGNDAITVQVGCALEGA